MKRLTGLLAAGAMLFVVGCRDTSTGHTSTGDMAMQQGCQTECCQDSDCGQGMFCQQGSCMAIPSGCMKDSDCMDPCLSCQNTMCVPNNQCDMSVPPMNTDGGMMTGMTVKIADFYNGNVVDKQKGISVTGVLIGEMNNDGHDKKTGHCKYAAYIQDPAGGMTNAGLRVSYLSSIVCNGFNASTGACTSAMGMPSCPYTPSTMTIADLMGAPSALGQQFTVTGSADLYAPPKPDGGLLPVQHSIDVTAISMPTAAPMPVTPVVVTDLTQFGQYGMGFITYEAMLVTLKPSAPAAVGTPDMYYNFSYGDAVNVPNAGGGISGNWSFIWDMKKMFPAAGAKFTSITGVAIPAFGGGVAPRQSSDFVM